MTTIDAFYIPNAKQQFLDGNGAPLAGASVYMYVPTTTTFKNTWQDSGQSSLNTNPIILDGNGEAIIYGSGNYRQRVVDVNNNLIWDQVVSAGDYGLLAADNNLSDVANAATALANLGGVSASQIYPIGSIYINNSNSTNPATLLGFGTWVALTGLGLVGVGTGTDSNGQSQTFTAGTQVGEYVHTLTVGEMPAHSHTDSGHTHQYVNVSGTSQFTGPGGAGNANNTTGISYANIQNNGGGGSHNNVMPVIGVYMWYRSA